MVNYNAASITPPQLSRLDALPITRQAEITKAYSPLILSKTVEMLKDATDNFTKDDELARKVDAELHTLLVNKGFYKSDSAAAPKAAASQGSELDELNKIIKVFEKSLKYADADERKDIEKTIKVFEKAKKYL